MIIRVPGDKSLTQRALILAALAGGTSRVSGLLHGGDPDSTAAALRALGAEIPEVPSDGSPIQIRGVGLRGLGAPADALDLGNSGTGARLLLGVLAGTAIEATVTGDASLRGRPMRRVTDPLAKMGASFDFLDVDDRLPVRVSGRHPLEPIDWPSPVASAQVKSALLLAGLTGQAFTLVTEPRQSRDHTERMFRQVGAQVIEHAVEGGWRVELRDPPAGIAPLDFRVPGDVSSAAFVVAFGALGGTPGETTLTEVGLNPTRSAFLDVAARMGVGLTVEPTRGADGTEPVGSIGVRASRLVATEVADDEVPLMIDELPLVAVMGSRAEGVTRIRGARELRAKESDRIDALVRNFRALGVEVEEHDDGLDVVGGDAPLSGAVRTFADHRIAMAFGVLGALPGNEIAIDRPEDAAVSFPGFWALLDSLARGAAT